MLPVVSIVGNSGSGKTTFLEQLIPKVIKRGYKVATIKHDAHNFEIDKPGKDSWKHRKAGAETVILSAKNRLAMIRELDTEVGLDDILANYISEDIDLVITEGYKTGDKPKIEIFRPTKFAKPLFDLDDDKVLTIVENKDNSNKLFADEEINKVVDLIVQEVIDK
ncbi:MULTISPECIES: molybdopterin-guanine dinucleotide biosynthesis protein B [unclassified Candidatus Frackibacter]|uniref:molybdopterin-guanine dinucleotide biosynthesis protein B n=1 Tax=unclassified Candidatus Frackibacter TaxID=2648818 RepID=UPI000799B7D9|nr:MULTISPECIES: molybdopterin-guanine dinucleotide biosynthesis protein B [unclassified Candidatus Frackibacter]KXS36685.1 MAG: molybdopterin-guanine dinucleotide biosynthesis protein B [Candidatus Frackibacter sp. T328-2]SDC40744.1 molybdopterin guanine dinucleotide biosynthesis accessory protein MobB [Candidatus Frackibacter sp. WG11]SEM60083.1 molybdopterin guanine dinucleotide biosynthesis accessory protein MobB [Candidatus Frackibacter sp. WG12]SFL61960.1 molybdopterin guanine dinucleotid